MKNLALSTPIFLLLAVMLCLPPASHCQEEVLQVVETEGTASIAGQDLARARAAAVRDALQKAVGQVAGQWLSPQTAAKQSQRLKEQLFKRAEEFIQDYRIVSELSADLYIVSVRSTVFANGIRSELLALGMIQPLPIDLSLNIVSLTIRGIVDYNTYSLCLAILKERGMGIREAIPREASWGMVRFDMKTMEKTATVAEQLQERLALQIHHQDDRILEVSLR